MKLDNRPDSSLPPPRPNRHVSVCKGHVERDTAVSQEPRNSAHRQKKQRLVEQSSKRRLMAGHEQPCERGLTGKVKRTVNPELPSREIDLPSRRHPMKQIRMNASQ